MTSKKSSDTESEVIGQNKNMFLHLYEIYYPKMSAENHKKPKKTATSLLQFELKTVTPEHGHMVSPLTDRLQMEHCKTSLLQDKQLAPLT
jgi:hypothetical protein